MGVYVKSSCPRCHHVLENYTRQYISIDIPFETCPDCGLVVLSSNRSEWKQLNIFSKAWHLFATTITGLYVSMLPSLALMFIYSEEWLSDNLYVFIIILSISEIYCYYKLGMRIGESNKRMESKEYRDKLKSLGILR